MSINTPALESATAAAVRVLANNAGFIGADLDVAVAIALAESGGDHTKYNPETAYFTEHQIPPDLAAGRGSCGLMQIFRHEHPEYDGANLFDPQVNLCYAFEIYLRAGRRFRPWSTYLNGKYRAFLPSGAR